MKITVETVVRSGIDAVWLAWNNPEDIKQWNAASEDWHTTASSVDLREGGTFTSRMEARDGSAGFDFAGTYTKVLPKELIEYKMVDCRSVLVIFAADADGVRITETFDTDSAFSPEQQQQGWQSILDRLAAYVESHQQ